MRNSCQLCLSLLGCTVNICGQVHELESQQMMDYLLNFLLEVPSRLFTVLVCCLLAALDLTGDTKDHRAPLLDYEVKGYSTVVLFRNNLCRSATADGC